MVLFAVIRLSADIEIAVPVDDGRVFVDITTLQSNEALGSPSSYTVMKSPYVWCMYRINYVDAEVMQFILHGKVWPRRSRG